MIARRLHRPEVSARHGSLGSPDVDGPGIALQRAAPGSRSLGRDADERAEDQDLSLEASPGSRIRGEPIAFAPQHRGRGLTHARTIRKPTMRHDGFMVLGQLALMNQAVASPSPASSSLRPKRTPSMSLRRPTRSHASAPEERRLGCAHERRAPNEASGFPFGRTGRSGLISSVRVSRTWSRRATGSSAPSLGRSSRMQP